MRVIGAQDLQRACPGIANDPKVFTRLDLVATSPVAGDIGDGRGGKDGLASTDEQAATFVGRLSAGVREDCGLGRKRKCQGSKQEFTWVNTRQRRQEVQNGARFSRVIRTISTAHW